MTTVRLKKHEEKRVVGGHPWIFSNEIEGVDGDRTPGVAARLLDHRGRFIGVGTYNPHSLIAFRLFSPREEDIDSPPFFREMIGRSIAFRRTLRLGGDAVRLVHGESDHLPGLVVDRYGDYLSIQLLTAGMERRKGILVDLLRELLDPAGIVARNDVSVRSLEGLQQGVEILAGTIPPLVPVTENGLHFVVDLLQGQKTGAFLDQKENHLLLREIVAGRRMLDCFSYAGSWGVHGAFYGAERVTCLDISARALSLVRENARRNGVEERVETEECDVFDRLRSLRGEGERFGVVVLDPPAFVKSRKSIGEGVKGYLTINRRGLELLEPGGYLVTCSCSHHVGRETFREVVAEAARQARRTVRLLKVCGQSPDHPVLLSFPESEYLKCLVLQVMDW